VLPAGGAVVEVAAALSVDDFLGAVAVEAPREGPESHFPDEFGLSAKKEVFVDKLHGSKNKTRAS
jgi:hypothetical protein